VRTTENSQAQLSGFTQSVNSARRRTIAFSARAADWPTARGLPGNNSHLQTGAARTPTIRFRRRSQAGFVCSAMEPCPLALADASSEYPRPHTAAHWMPHTGPGNLLQRHNEDNRFPLHDDKKTEPSLANVRVSYQFSTCVRFSTGSIPQPAFAQSARRVRQHPMRYPNSQARLPCMRRAIQYCRRHARRNRQEVLLNIIGYQAQLLFRRAVIGKIYSQVLQCRPPRGKITFSGVEV